MTSSRPSGCSPAPGRLPRAPVFSPSHPCDALANPEPILWHAEPGETVQLRATAAAAYKALQPVKLTIYRSDQTRVKTFETTVAIGPGVTELPFTWDGTQDATLEGIAEPGVYLFQWQVGSAGPTMDADQDKSALTQIVQTRSELTGTYDDATDANGIRDGCVVEDHGNPVTTPQEGCVRVFDGDLNVIADTALANPVANPPNASEPIWSEANFDMVIAESECHLFAVRDGHTRTDRAHRSRWCLQMNDRKVRPLADNYCFIPEAGRVDHSAREWQKRLWDAASSYRGAYRARANGSVSAGFIMGALPADRIVHYWGHGNAGGVTTASQMIRAQRAYPGETGAFLADANLANARLIVWQACESALTDPDHGNLCQAAVARGAKCSLGFQEPVSYQERLASCARQWAHFFWQALAQGRNQNGVPSTVDDACAFAVQKVREYNGGDPMGYDTAVVFGNGATRVVPAN